MQLHISSLPSQAYPLFLDRINSLLSHPTELKPGIVQLCLELFRYYRELFFWALAMTFFETSYPVSSADVNIILEQNTWQAANFSYGKK